MQFHLLTGAQVAAAVADAVGPELTGIRLSPYSDFQDATDPETLDLNLYLVDKLSEMGLLYVHAVESRISGNIDAEDNQESLEPLRRAFKVRSTQRQEKRWIYYHRGFVHHGGTGKELFCRR